MLSFPQYVHPFYEELLLFVLPSESVNNRDRERLCFLIRDKPVKMAPMLAHTPPHIWDLSIQPTHVSLGLLQRRRSRLATRFTQASCASQRNHTAAILSVLTCTRCNYTACKTAKSFFFLFHFDMEVVLREQLRPQLVLMEKSMSGIRKIQKPTYFACGERTNQ